MTNDAKLGMLVGVLGVVVAAVLFANPAPPQTAESPQPAPSKPAAVVVAPLATSVAAAPTEPPRDREPLPTTPVVRPRKEPTAQPVSRQPDADEEP